MPRAVVSILIVSFVFRVPVAHEYMARRRDRSEREAEALRQGKIQDGYAKADPLPAIEHRGKKSVDVDVFGVERMGRESESASPRKYSH